MAKTTKEKMLARQKRVRGDIIGTAKRPRLSVYRSNKAIYAQIINDIKGETLVSASSNSLPKSKETKNTVASVGEELAKKALKKKIKTVVFDRGGYKYHGQVKDLAEGARKGGLEF